MKILYFAWVREKVGLAEETVQPPESVRTVADLITWLKTRGPEYESAFAQAKVIRAALDRTHVAHGAALGEAREVAFFPPVTGG